MVVNNNMDKNECINSDESLKNNNNCSTSYDKKGVTTMQILQKCTLCPHECQVNRLEGQLRKM